jgi:hypothetical protein
VLLVIDRPGLPRRISPFGWSAALHLSVLLALSFPLSRLAADGSAAPTGAEPIVVFTIPSVPAGGSASESHPADEAAAPSEDLGIDLPAGAASIRVAEFTFDFAAVVSRAASLFPLLEHPVIDELARVRRENDAEALKNPLLHVESPAAAAPPLELSAEQLQSLTDKAWSRRDRWRAFQSIATLANRHSASQGRVPDLLRAYVDQNLLQLFVDTSIRDPRLWAQLAVAADHRDFVEFIVAYAAQQPGTKGRTELLFLLDKIAQSNLHALITLVDSNPAVQLQATRAASDDAYRALVTMREHYLAEIERLGIGSREALISHYAEARLTMLGNILRTTPDGYRAGDARYLMGTIRWERGDRTEAIETWRRIEVVEPSDTYARTYSAILAAIRSAEGDSIGRAIDKSLASEHSRWVMQSIDRLLGFGYRVDTF